MNFTSTSINFQVVMDNPEQDRKITDQELEYLRTSIGKDNKMRSPLLFSGPKIRKAYFEAPNRKFYFNDPLKI